MSALLIALAVTNGVVTVRFAAPVAGSYSVQASEDGWRWRVVASLPPMRAGERAVVSERVSKGCAIYRVEWRATVAVSK